MLLTARTLISLTLILSAVAAPSTFSRHVVHESRSNVPRGWTPVRRAEPSMILPLRVGLAQANLENIEAYIMEVSHPESPNYGKHWSTAKVAETFRPTNESVDTVHTWLVDSGIEPDRVRLSPSAGWVKADVTVEEAERLLGTEYYVYQFGEKGGEGHVACLEKYHLPEHVAKHVEIVTPTLHFDVKPKSGKPQLERAERRSGQPGFNLSSPKTTGVIENLYSELTDCDNQIVPDCLRALYNFDYTPVATKNNSIAIVEYTPQAYVPSDLDMFFANFSPSQVGTRPVLDSIDGGTVQTQLVGMDYNGESNLDLQYAMALVGPTQPVTLYQNGDMIESASFNNFLDALDGSYCTFDGGDDPEFDQKYPDPSAGGYKGPEDCGTYTPAYVMSTSYNYYEPDMTPAYQERQCTEYAKLGLMGVTILFASGDEGVAGSQGICQTADGQEEYGGTVFNPGWPSTCPYVTSVGATQVNPGASVYEPESACEQTIYSGGGFSNRFAMPEYQKAAVEHYLTTYPPPYSSAVYNASGTSRAFPDMAANGANYVVAINGEYHRVYGTSCASPVSAAMFSAINDARLAVGKGPIGFINPSIYSPLFKEAFNDITNGTNPGCGTAGFSAEPGWDPVTGVGTPNFAKLLDLWLGLP